MKDFSHTMHSLTCVLVVVCVVRKPCPCPSGDLGSGDGDGDRMKNSIFERGAQGCVTPCPPFMYSNTANRSPFFDGPFIVASTHSPVERVKITGRPG